MDEVTLIEGKILIQEVDIFYEEIDVASPVRYSG